ncbi:DUF6302 family protein [Streptomyces sp. CL12-4]|uniref:DUF6302 family protein n=1 Tax=Streptomyces sp. CL12-4 TaxID=2810306 RepID=UPI001EFA67E2|nr:DUF6302 family protein [Streptomyces sp. CL12-4]MCG8970205.1 hypothetical protein [Streptomyces sp. CL12-4]
MIMPLLRRRPPNVYLRPPGAPDAWEVVWYSERLADPSLLDSAVVAVVDRVGYLAVPVGGAGNQRRGGFLAVDDRLTARCLHYVLMGRAGFPAVRVQWSTDRSVCHNVEWGEAPPDTDDDQVRGHFYGYSEQAIDRFAVPRT